MKHKEFALKLIFSARRADLKLNNRGFSIIEITSAVVLVSILSVFSVTQYNRSKTKSFTKEAKLQLGHLHRMEKIYFIEHNTFTFELAGNMFPKGTLLYNVGFGSGALDYKLNPCAPGGSAPFINNYYELCEDDIGSGKRKDCGFRNKQGNTPSLVPAYKELRSSNYYKPNHNCQTPLNPPKPEQMTNSDDRADHCDSTLNTLIKSWSENEDKFYLTFIAYAVGDILDPKEFLSPANKLDVWRINGNGYLEHCQDPLDAGSSSTCLITMNKKEDDASEYCKRPS